MQGLAMRIGGDRINAFIKENNLPAAEEWSEADILHRASIHGILPYFINAVNSSDNIILVAPDYLKGIKKILKYNHFISVPEKNCWQHYNRIRQDVADKLKLTGLYLKDKKNFSNLHLDYTVVLFVASMPANILVDSLYKEFGKYASLLDIGSILDPFVNRKTRSYHKKPDLDLIAINKFE